LRGGQARSRDHRGRSRGIDHILVSDGVTGHARETEVHDKLLHDESVADAFDAKAAERDDAPAVAPFDLTD
jgi:hypothetical protein